MAKYANNQLICIAVELMTTHSVNCRFVELLIKIELAAAFHLRNANRKTKR